MKTDPFAGAQFQLTALTQELRLTQSRGACCGPTRIARDAGHADGTSFAATLRTSLLEIRMQNFAAVGVLFGGDGKAAGGASAIDALLAARGLSESAPIRDVAAIGGLSPTGRNLALFDPERAYQMMTLINRKEVDWQQESGLIDAMGGGIAELAQLGRDLADISGSADSITAAQALQGLLDRYNAWETQFDLDVQAGGLLAGTQAAHASRFELKQSIENPFFGAAEGLRGLRELGVAVDPATGTATLDSERFASTFADRPKAARTALHEFGEGFARSAGLLIAADNFIDKRTDNLDRVLAYLHENKPSLQAEFGLGDAPTVA